MHSQCASLSTLRRDWRRPSDLPLRVQMHSMPAQSICWLAAIGNRGVYQVAGHAQYLQPGMSSYGWCNQYPMLLIFLSNTPFPLFQPSG